ncbi:hypothetical protein F5X68DRAFT_204911 [Plectosphaerella plurivora]|uniref:Uncharacterized protein n=1 Tax=Plectosphaerella plurivora TaxID=936078 RepID=A0A9P8VFQ2_9PEZI|nr:hypothetical protein F5X68DRAFT_204911 [Plectosphaerella plurivora]
MAAENGDKTEATSPTSTSSWRRRRPQQQQQQQQQRRLPPWLNHFNGPDLKTLFRCCVAVWISMLLVFIQPSLDAIGIATFLGAILLFIVPPASTLLVYLLAALSLLVGMCVAWAWGLLTMKAAQAARPASETQALVAALRDQAVATAQQTGQTPAQEAQILVFNGFMLDARVTAVYYVMGCAFIYFISRARCANPKLVVMQIFGIIVTDVSILTGPSLPNWMPDLWSVLVKPSAIGIGLGLACCLIFFPQSTSHVLLGQLTTLTRLSASAITTTQQRLSDDAEAPPLTSTNLKATRRSLIALFKASQSNLAFLPLNVSRGLWGPDDVQTLHHCVQDLMTTSLTLIDYHIARLNAAQMTQEREQEQEEHGEDVYSPERQDGYQIGQRHRREASSLVLALQRPEHNAIRSETRKTIQASTADVLQIGVDAAGLAASYISTVNASRWIRKPPPSQLNDMAVNLQDLLARLRTARDECITNTSAGVLEAHAELFDDQGRLKKTEGLADRPFLPSMVIAMVFEERILAVTSALEVLLEALLKLSQTRTTHRLWLPNRLRYALSWLFDGRSSVPASGDGGPNEKDPDDEEIEPAPEGEVDYSFDERKKEARRRLEVSRGHPGTSAARRGKVTSALLGTCRWLTNPAGMYAMRMVIVTVATSIPSAIPSSAGFFYREKGIWAVISAQTVLVIYMADFTFSLVSRVLGTIIGGVMGMVAWYMGAGTGPGNSYGMAASTALMIVPIMWMRLFLPPAFSVAVIMGAATFALVIGFSWDEGHTTQYGLPGKGYVAFWKRVVTVLIGFVASLIVQVFPKPPSATNHVRKTLANSVRTLSDHYALLLSNWGRSATDGNDAALDAVASQISLELAEALAAVDPSIALLKMEPTFGPFDQTVLQRTQEQCQYMNQALGGLLKLAASLPREFQDRLVRLSGIQDNRTIGDVMAVLGIIEQALRTGSPLPERLPAPLVRRAVDSYLQVDDGSMMSAVLVKDENHRRYCVAVSLYLKFLTSIDDLVLVLKSALGERHIIYQWESETREGV